MWEQIRLDVFPQNERREAAYSELSYQGLLLWLFEV